LASRDGSTTFTAELAVPGLDSAGHSDEARPVIVKLGPGGGLDRRFGGDGVVVRPIRSSYGASRLVRQPNGKLILVDFQGFDFQGSNRASVTRFNPGGGVDPSWRMRQSDWSDGFRSEGTAAVSGNARLLVAGSRETAGVELLRIVRLRAGTPPRR
jgi:hypothetical protein